jgi:hypothetical protein
MIDQPYSAAVNFLDDAKQPMVKRGGIVGERGVLQNTPFKFKRSVLNYS